MKGHVLVTPAKAQWEICSVVKYFPCSMLFLEKRDAVWPGNQIDKEGGFIVTYLKIAQLLLKQVLGIWLFC